MTAPAAARKNRWGDRVYPIPVPGQPAELEPPRLPSVSNILKALPAPGLETWKQKVVAYHIATAPDLQALAASATGVKGDGSKAAYDAVKQALERERKAANLGTAAHSFTEQVDAGTYKPDAAPAAVRSLMERYQGLIATYGIEILASECTVFNHEIGYAGTADRFVRLPDLGVVVADYKTGADMYGDVALQLAAYANAEGIWDGENHQPLPDGLRRDVGLVIHCPAHDDRADLLVVELTAAWPTFRSLTVVRRWQDEGSKVAIVGPHTVANGDETVTFRNAWLRRRLLVLRDEHPRAFETLAVEWPEGIPTPKARDLTHTELDTVAAVVRDIEARFAIPFGELDPAGVVEPPTYADEARMTAIRQRHEALPADLAAKVKAESPVPAGAVLIHDEWATVLEQKIAAAELEATDRGGVARLILAELPGDIAAAIAVTIRTETGPLWSEAGMDLLTELVDAHADGRLPDLVATAT